MLGPTAAGDHGLAGYETRVVGEEEFDHRGHFLWIGYATHGGAADDVVYQARVGRTSHFGVGEAGGQAVDTDVVGGKGFGAVSGEGDEGCLGGGIVDIALFEEDAGQGRDVDDAAIALLDHFVFDGPGGKEGAIHVDIEHALPLGKAELVVVFGGGDSGVVDQELDGAEVVADFGDDVLHFFLLGNVRLDGDGLAAVGFDLGTDFLGGGFVLLVVAGDFGAVLGQHQAYGSADASGAAGYQSGAPGE